MSGSDSKGGNGRGSRTLRIVFFGVAASLFVVVAVHVFGSGQAGAWEAGPVGTPLKDLPVVDGQGRAVVVDHPALIYVYSSDCRYCVPMNDRLARFVSGEPTPVSLYALAADRNSGRIEALRPSFRRIELSRGEPRLSFVQRVPYLVRTDTAGEVIKAYVGLAEPDALQELVAPASHP